jgi:hypothetical protein
MDLTKKAARELAKEERKHELLRGNLFNEAVAVSLYLCDKARPADLAGINSIIRAGGGLGKAKEVLDLFVREGYAKHIGSGRYTATEKLRDGVDETGGTVYVNQENSYVVGMMPGAWLPQKRGGK